MKDINNNTYKSSFFVIPSYILNIPGLTLSYLKVYETIFQFWNHGKLCYLSDAEIIDRTGLSKSQIYEAFSFFEEKNELIRRRKGVKRYFVQPEKSIEHFIEENDDKNIDQTSALPDPNVRCSGRTTSDRAEHNIKNINNNKLNKPPIVPLKNSSSKNLDEYPDEKIQKNNPHEIPIELIQEWKRYRKKPITERVWIKTNKVMLKLKELGINPEEAFEIMLEHQWIGMELRYFQEELEFRKGGKLKHKKHKSCTYDNNDTSWAVFTEEEMMLL